MATSMMSDSIASQELLNQYLAAQLPFPNAPSRGAIEKLIGETQISLECLFPSFKDTCTSLKSTSDKISKLFDKITDMLTQYVDPKKVRLVTFVLNQLYLVKDNISIPRFFSFLLSVYLYLGKTYSEFVDLVKRLINVCVDEPVNIPTLGNTYPEVIPGEAQMGILGIVESALDAVSDNVSLVTGGVTLLLTSILGFSLDLTSVSNLMRKIKFTGDGLSSVNHWVRDIVDYIVDQYYQHIYGCTKKEMALRQVVPLFAKYQQRVYTLLSIPSAKFLESKYLCDKVKDTYKMGQEISCSLAAKDRLLARELSYVFSNTERKFLPLYENVKSSPLFLNVTRNRPNTLYFYGEPGVGKSNLINFLSVNLAKELYPERTFNGENSVMWSRRVENEFHDGYAHQPIVQFDDFLQAVDSKTNPNPEIRELIYMVNDAPYQLHMSDIKEKKSVYFDSDHVFASSNIKVPTVQSIHDVSALRRRFDFAYHVHVKPEYGVMHRVGNKSYLRVDTTKVSSPLDMSIYELHMYDLETGNPCASADGTPVVYDYRQMFNHYVAHVRKSKDKAQCVRQVIYEQLGVQISTEDFQNMFETQTLDSLIGEAFTVLDDGESHEIPSLDSLYAPPTPEGELFPDIEAYLSDSFEGTPCAEIMRHLSEQSETYEVACDENDEDDVDNMSDRTSSNSYLQEIRHKCSQLYASVPKCFSYAFEKIRKILRKIYDSFSKNNMLKLLGLATLVGTAVLYLFYPKNSGCKLATVQKNIFSHVCKSACDKCEYIKNICGGFITLDSTKQPRYQLADWNLRAAQILARDDSRYNPIVDYWHQFIDDLGIKGESQFMTRANRRRSRRVVCESYGRDSVACSNPEAYGRVAGFAAGCESYGRENVVAGEVQVGTNLNLDSVLAASEQYLNVVMRNSVQVVTTRFEGRGLFVVGRVMLINRHYADMIKQVDTFEIVNPCQDKGTIVYVKECQFVDVEREGHPQDLTLVSLPRMIPCRPSLLNKLVQSSQQAFVDESGATLVGFKKIKGVHTFSEQHMPHVDVQNVMSKNAAGVSYELRKAYAYNAHTTKGDCGMLLFTHSPKVGAKLIGFHASGNRKYGLGFSEALNLRSMEEALAKLDADRRVSYEYPEASFKGVTQNFDLGDVVHIGDAGVTVMAAEKTEISPSVLNGVLAEPKCKPAHLRDFTRNGETISPMKKGLAKVANIQQRLDPELLQIAAEDTKRTVLKMNDPPKYGVLSYEEAISGVEGDDYLSGIKRQTSPGYPWVSQKKTKLPGKKEWLNVITPEGVTDDYRYDHPDLKAAVQQRVEKAKQGIRIPAIYTATLKDERRPIEKVDAGKTRVFTAAPQDYVIPVRQYFLDFVAAVQRNRVLNEVAVGIDHNVEWGQLYQWLQAYGDCNIAGDFSNFDGSLLSEVLWKILDIINEWYDDGEENQLVRRILFEDIVNSFVYCKGYIIQWTHSQPSGNPLTVIINSLFQMVVFRYVYIQLKCANHLPKVCDFRRNVRMVVYGDDGVLSVREHVVTWFNQTSITKAFAQIGLTYTDEAKTGVLYQHRSLLDVTFLKRSFKFVEGVWQGALDRDVIYEMCLWTRNKFNKEQTVYNVQDALREATNHGREFYNAFSHEVESACAKVDLEIDVYTYDEMLEWKYAHFL